MSKRYAIFVALILIISSSETPALAEFNKPETVIENYIKAVVAGDWKQAENYWFPHDIEKANRLGIKYIDDNFKYDNDSPLIIYLDFIRSKEKKIVFKKTEEFVEYSVVVLQLVTANDSIEFKYYLIFDNNQWFITSPIYLFTKNWSSIQTNFVNIMFSDSTLINPFALKSLDTFINKIADTLKIFPEKMKILAENKIDYLLCNKEEMKLLTGFDANGISNLQFDAIVSRHLPHPHELVHLLINYSLGELPLFTLPVLQEGFAVALGGRWGKSPEVVKQLSPILISENICKLDDLLLSVGFNQTMPDISYPVAGSFSKMLISEYGIDNYKKIYLLLSGSLDKVQKLTPSEVKITIEQICKTDWETINNQFKRHLDQLKNINLKPGISKSGNNISELSGDSLIVFVKETEDCYEFIIRSLNNTPAGTILLHNNNYLSSGNYRSSMYTEQFPNSEYSGFKYGIKFDINETGFYNYMTNCLEAKYATAFSPNINYWDEKLSSISFSLKKSVLQTDLKTFDMELRALPTP